MAHGFIDKGSRTTFVSKKELAWHRLGVTVDAMTSAECMVLAGLDFEVALAPLYSPVGEFLTVEQSKTKSLALRDTDRGLKQAIVVPNAYATYRTDTNVAFGTVGNRYEVVQNLEAFDFFDEIIGQGHAAYETAGALGNGETIFITAKLPSKLVVRKEDIDKYLLFTMSHDGSGSIKVMFTPIRVVCNNTLSAALTGREKVTIKHTKNARERLDLAPTLLGITKNASENYEKVFDRFTRVAIDDEEVENFVDKIFKFDYEELSDLSTKSLNKRNAILEYYETGVGQAGIQGTLWGAYNMVTGYLQNGVDKKAEAQFTNEFLKTNADIRANAMKELLELAK